MELIELEDHFSDIGGQFLRSSFDIQQSLKGIKAYLFDWDGVFNDGSKLGSEGSRYSEVDSAGLRMLRYGHYQRFGHIPLLGVVTGAKNPVAIDLMKSHQGDIVYQKTLRKSIALEHFLAHNQIQAEEVCYVFDDVLDLSIAQRVGIRLCIGRLANPLFLGLVAGSNLADYITASQGNEHAVRECCELLLGLMGNYSQVVQQFIGDQSHYDEFKNKLAQKELSAYEFENGKFNLL